MILILYILADTDYSINKEKVMSEKKEATLEDVKRYARRKHVGQMYGDYYYDKHLHDVSHVLAEFGFSKEAYPHLHKACYTHDIFEDTATSYNDVKKRFGEMVAEISYAVTDELGRNRKERAAKTHPKIKGFYEATVIKLCDRVANIREGIRTDSDLKNMYKKEYPEFRLDIFDVETVEKHPKLKGLWNILDEIFDYKEQTNE